MKAITLRSSTQKTHLKVIKNTLNGKRSDIKLYINTLVPNFSYMNDKGEKVTPKNCAY